MDVATGKTGLVMLAGGLAGGVLGALQGVVPTSEGVGSGIVGGAAVSAVAWGIHLQKVADHARRLHRLENSKAEKDQVETLKQLLQELRDDVKWLVREKRGE